MEWDLGWTGLGLLVGMSFGFGIGAHLVTMVLRQHPTPWLWAIGSTTYFIAGVVVSEMWFGWATAAELQPNIDGLSFDEVMLFATVSGIVVVLATWYLTRRSRVGTDGP
jgi:branched-subunit amino acid ABC-type transport system permease component